MKFISVLASLGVLSAVNAQDSYVEGWRANIGPYPGVTSSRPIGSTTFSRTSDGKLRVLYAVQGLEKNVHAAKLHIHTGTSCETAEGIGSHPWRPEVYANSYYDTDWKGRAAGEFVLDIGATNWRSWNEGKVFIFHTKDGGIIGCGVVDNFKGAPSVATWQQPVESRCIYDNVWTNENDWYDGSAGQTCQCKGGQWSSCADTKANSCWSSSSVFLHGESWTNPDDLTCECSNGSWINCVEPEPEPVGEFATRVFPVLARDRVDAIPDEGFVFDLINAEGEEGPGGMIQVANAASFPAVQGHSTSAALFTIDPCGINQPHLHPRGTETLYAIDVEQLRVAFVNENGRGIKQNDMRTGHITFFPQGLIHYQQNLSCKTAQYLAVLSSDDAGVLTVAPQFFRFEGQALEAAFGTNNLPTFEELPGGPGEGIAECRKRCGMPASDSWGGSFSWDNFGGM